MNLGSSSSGSNARKSQLQQQSSKVGSNAIADSQQRGVAFNSETASFGGQGNGKNQENTYQNLHQQQVQYHEQQFASNSSNQEDIDGYLKEALKKEISLRFMLGIYKLHALQVKSSPPEQSFAFEKIKNHALRVQVEEALALKDEQHEQLETAVTKGQDQQTLSLFGRNNSNSPTQSKEEWAKQLEAREQKLLSRMKCLKFNEVSVRETASQTSGGGQQYSPLKTSQQLQQDTRLDEIHSCERELQILNDELHAKCSYQDELNQELKNQENELQLRVQELKLEPLNLLGSPQALQDRLSTLKSELYDNFRQYTNNLPAINQKLKSENDLFYLLFDNWEESKEFLKRKSSLLKNLELHLLEERFKMEIVENYLKKEYDLIKTQKNELSADKQKYAFVMQYEQTLKKETELLKQRQDAFERVQLASSNSYNERLQGRNKGLNEANEKPEMTFRKIQQQDGQMDSAVHQSRGREGKDYYSEEEQGTIHSLEEENTFLRDELDDLKRRIYEYEQHQEQQQQFSNPSAHNEMVDVHADNEFETVAQLQQFQNQSSEIQQILAETRQRRLTIKFAEMWVRFSLKRSRGQNLLLKTFGLYLWRIAQFDTPHTRKLQQIEFDPPAQRYLEQKWMQKAASLQKIGRFPFVKRTKINKLLKNYPLSFKPLLTIFVDNNQKDLSKNRKAYEMAMIDHERKKFFQTRMAVLLNSILLKQRRQERLMVVVGFHRFARNCFRSGCNLDRNPSTVGQDNGSSSAIGSRQESAMVIGKGAFEDSLKWDKVVSTKRDKSPISNGNNKLKNGNSGLQMKLPTPKQIEEQLTREMTVVMNKKIKRLQAVCIMVGLTLRKEVTTMHAVSKAFSSWRHENIVSQKQLVTKELNYINYEIQERVFNDSIFKTKVRLAQTQLDSKLALLQELLSAIHQSAEQ